MANIFQFDWEVSLIVWLQNIIENRPFLKSLFVLLTQFGEPILPVLLAVVVYYGYKKEWGRNMILSFLFPQIITDQLKNIFLRMRPYMANEVIKCLWAPEKGYDIYDIARQGYSFPSGHATSISAVMATLYLYERKKLFAKSYLPVVFLVCLSRVALGVHYPTDVLTGALISLVAVFVFDALIKKVSKKILYPLLTLYCLTGVLFCHSDDYYSVIGLTMGFMLADLFEERFVAFENTKKPLKIILRTLGGTVVFLGLSQLMKLPFSTEFLEADQLASFLFRALRYGVSVFATFGLYPYLFRYSLFA